MNVFCVLLIYNVLLYIMHSFHWTVYVVGVCVGEVLLFQNGQNGFVRKTQIQYKLDHLAHVDSLVLGQSC